MPERKIGTIDPPQQQGHCKKPKTKDSTECPPGA
jgi:hypothetical protein